jgi:hypothetical protein
MPTNYCRHIRPSGRRCQSPALRNRPYCFHHATAKAYLRVLHPPEDGTQNIMQEVTTGLADQIRREPLMAEYFSNARGPVILDFPALEDANSIQLALSMVLTVLGQNRLEPRRAANMLYNLQIASGNVRNVSYDESRAVRDIVQDDSGNLLSSDEDPQQVQEVQDYLKELEQRKLALNPDDYEDGIPDDEDVEDF